MSSSQPAADDVEALRDFFVAEARDILRALEPPMLRLARDPADREMAAEVFRRVHSLKGMAATVGYAPMTELAHTLEELLDRLRKGTTTPTPAVVELIVTGVDELADLVDAFAGRSGAAGPGAGEPRPPGAVEAVPPPLVDADEPIRVGVRVFDSLYDLVVRLVAGQACLDARLGAAADPDLREALAEQTRTVRELRDAVLEARMVAAGQLFARFPRLVRDLARREGKEVALVVEGEGTTLDRAVLDRLADPLTHLLRNAVHHGVEPPAERARLGKPARATIRLVAGRERGQALVMVADDGRGLAPEAIAHHAVERGLISAAEASRLDRESRLELIFRPGFSTSDDVSDVSGRGVGLDVVARAASSLGGSVEVRSTPGAGASFQLRVPVSIAFASVLLVEAAGELYALPVGGLAATESGADLPRTVALADLLALPQPGKDDKPSDRSNLGPPAGSGTTLIVESGNRRVGLAVDRAQRVEEIVVRQLGGIFERYPGLSGATVLGDGRVVPILDTTELVRWVLEVPDVRLALAEAQTRPS